MNEDFYLISYETYEYEPRDDWDVGDWVEHVETTAPMTLEALAKERDRLARAYGRIRNFKAFVLHPVAVELWDNDDEHSR